MAYNTLKLDKVLTNPEKMSVRRTEIRKLVLLSGAKSSPPHHVTNKSSAKQGKKPALTRYDTACGLKKRSAGLHKGLFLSNSAQ